MPSAVAGLITLAYVAPSAWAAQTNQPTPSTDSHAEAWLLLLAGLAALLFISRRQGTRSRPERTSR